MILTAAELEEFRRDAESLMQDTCTVSRRSGSTKVDGLDAPAFAQMFTSPCKVAGRSQGGDVSPRTVTVGGVERVVIQGGVHLPVTAEAVREGDRIEVTEIGSATDPALLGSTWEVVGFAGKSWATARRLDVVEVP